MVRYAVAAREMNDVMARLRRLFDIRITFFDMQGIEAVDFPIKPMSRFCSVFRKNKKHNALCAACDKRHLEEAKRSREIHFYHCHMGLIEGIVPLYDRRNFYLGAIAFGQLRDPNHTPPLELPNGLKALYNRLPPYSREEAEDIGYVLKCVSESIIEKELIRVRNKLWAEKLERFCEEHLHEKVTVARMARAVGRSESFVAHHFFAEFGKTPRQYLLARRMEEAKIMLGNGMTVQDAAERLGFCDAFHFSRTFKRYWKTTPSACRQG